MFTLVGLVSKPLAHFITSQVERFADSLGSCSRASTASRSCAIPSATGPPARFRFLVLVRPWSRRARDAGSGVRLTTWVCPVSGSSPPRIARLLRGRNQIRRVRDRHRETLLRSAPPSSPAWAFTFISYVVQLATAGLFLGLGSRRLARSVLSAPLLNGRTQRPRPARLGLDQLAIRRARQSSWSVDLRESQPGYQHRTRTQSRWLRRCRKDAFGKMIQSPVGIRAGLPTTTVAKPGHSYRELVETKPGGSGR